VLAIGFNLVKRWMEQEAVETTPIEK